MFVGGDGNFQLVRNNKGDGEATDPSYFGNNAFYSPNNLHSSSKPTQILTVTNYVPILTYKVDQYNPVIWHSQLPCSTTLHFMIYPCSFSSLVVQPF